MSGQFGWGSLELMLGLEEGRETGIVTSGSEVIPLSITGSQTPRTPALRGTGSSLMTGQTSSQERYSGGDRWLANIRAV